MHYDRISHVTYKYVRYALIGAVIFLCAFSAMPMKTAANRLAGAADADGTVSCTGSNTLLMTDYQIKPPTYMPGALRTGNKLTIDFTMVVNK